jgi:hypothetical protein
MSGQLRYDWYMGFYYAIIHKVMATLIHCSTVADRG